MTKVERDNLMELIAAKGFKCSFKYYADNGETDIHVSW